MQNPPAKFIESAEGQHAYFYHLIELYFSSTLYYTTGPTITIDDNTYINGEMKAPGVILDGDDRGVRTGKLFFIDSNFALSTLIAIEGLAYKRIVIKSYYGPEIPSVSDDFKLELDGFISGATFKKEISLKAVSGRYPTKQSPGISVEQVMVPLPVGTILNFPSGPVVLESN